VWPTDLSEALTSHIAIVGDTVLRPTLRQALALPACMQSAVDKMMAMALHLKQVLGHVGRWVALIADAMQTYCTCTGAQLHTGTCATPMKL